MTEVQKIQKDFNKVISYSQGIPEPKTDNLFERWLDAKRDFIEAFGGKFVYETEESVTLSLSPEDKEDKVIDFIETLESIYGNKGKWFQLIDFIFENKNSFYDNTVSVAYEKDGIKIPVGMKLIKAFKFFIEDKDTLTKIQNQASLMVQEEKIEGRLCLSVHPLDYLSSSENNYNWTTCHALDSDYRSGNLSYMVDSSTVMCYLKSDKNSWIDGFPKEVPWNSKKWRVLIHFSERWDMIFLGRQYPFFSPVGEASITRLLRDSGLGDYSEWLSEKYRTFSPDKDSRVHFTYKKIYYPVSDGVIPLTDLVKRGKNSLNYNDILDSTSDLYERKYAYREKYSSKDLKSTVFGSDLTTRFVIGEKCLCTRCENEEIELSGSFMCNNCELKYGDCEDDIFDYCVCCGERYFYDDGIWVSGEEECVCPNCADEQTFVCDFCCESFYRNSMRIINDTIPPICPTCYENWLESEEGKEEVGEEY